MVFQQLAQRLYGRLLHHALKHRRSVALGHEHPVILGYFGAKPQSVAHDIGLGDGLQGLSGTYIDVAANNHCVHVGRRLAHYLLVKRHLQRQQILRKALSALPSEHGNGCQHLARRCVGGQSAALSAGMKQQPAVGGEPLVERHSVAMLTVTGL